MEYVDEEQRVVVFTRAEVKFWKEQGAIVERDGDMYWCGMKVVPNRYVGTGELV
jgi:hypothetical protein